MGKKRSGGVWAAMVAVLAMCAVLMLLAAGCGPSGSKGAASTSATAAAVIGRQQAIDLVAVTSAAIAENAKGTLAAIDAGVSPYVNSANPALYAFVYDTQVTLIATPDATVRGQSMKGRPDAVGNMFRDEIVTGALANGSGWVQYVYKEPGAEGLFAKETYYTLAIGDDGNKYVVCAGLYLGPYEGTTSSTGTSTSISATEVTKADVQAFVDKAVSYATEKGKDTALAAFTGPGGEFHQGELYIYAYDFSGTVIAHGGDAKLVGKNLIDMKDPNGVMVIRELVSLAQQGSGWLYYSWPNPAHGDQSEPKLGYVVKVGNDWFLGSGTYGPAAIER